MSVSNRFESFVFNEPHQPTTFQPIRSIESNRIDARLVCLGMPRPGHVSSVEEVLAQQLGYEVGERCPVVGRLIAWGRALGAHFGRLAAAQTRRIGRFWYAPRSARRPIRSTSIDSGSIGRGQGGLECPPPLSNGRGSEQRKRHRVCLCSCSKSPNQKTTHSTQHHPRVLTHSLPFHPTPTYTGAFERNRTKRWPPQPPPSGSRGAGGPRPAAASAIAVRSCSSPSCSAAWSRRPTRRWV